MEDTKILPIKIVDAIYDMSKEYEQREQYIYFATKLAELDYSDGIDEDDIIAEVCILPKHKRL